MIEDNITARNRFLDSINDADFPSEVKILSIESGLNNTTKLIVDRIGDIVEGDYISISKTANYDTDEALVITIDEPSNSIYIEIPFTSNDSGIILNTTHRYKDSVFDIKRFPAIGLTAGEIDFEQDAVTQIVDVSYDYWLFIADRIDNHKLATPSDSLEDTQKYLCNKFLEIVPSTVDTSEMRIGIESMTPLETIIDKKDVSMLLGRLTIYPKNKQ